MRYTSISYTIPDVTVPFVGPVIDWSQVITASVIVTVGSGISVAYTYELSNDPDTTNTIGTAFTPTNWISAGGNSIVYGTNPSNKLGLSVASRWARFKMAAATAGTGSAVMNVMMQSA
jgi:hypothetical protein